MHKDCIKCLDPVPHAAPHPEQFLLLLRDLEHLVLEAHDFFLDGTPLRILLTNLLYRALLQLILDVKGEHFDSTH